MPSRDRSADVMAPSAATWQVLPGGQSPSRIPATPALWPACSTAASRALAARAGDAISAAAGSGGAAGSPGGSSPVSRAAGYAGPAHDEGLGLVEGGVEGGGDDQAGQARPAEVVAVVAGEQQGGVGGGHDHFRRAAGLAGHCPGQQAGQDRAGRGGRARAGQAEAAEGGDVRADLAAAAHSEGDHAGWLRPAGRRGRRLHGAGRVRGGACVPGRVAEGRAGAGGRRPGIIRAGILTGEVRVRVRVASLCRGRGGGRRAGGAAQGGDRGRDGRPGRVQPGGERFAGPVTAPPVNAGDHQRRGDRGGQAGAGEATRREADARCPVPVAVLAGSGPAGAGVPRMMRWRGRWPRRAAPAGGRRGGRDRVRAGGRVPAAAAGSSRAR